MCESLRNVLLRRKVVVKMSDSDKIKTIEFLSKEYIARKFEANIPREYSDFLAEMESLAPAAGHNFITIADNTPPALIGDSVVAYIKQLISVTTSSQITSAFAKYDWTDMFEQPLNPNPNPTPSPPIWESSR